MIHENRKSIKRNLRENGSMIQIYTILIDSKYCYVFVWVCFIEIRPDCFYSPVIIAMNSSKSIVPLPSSSTSSTIWSRLCSLSVESISRRISFNVLVVIYPFPKFKVRSIYHDLKWILALNQHTAAQRNHV